MQEAYVLPVETAETHDIRGLVLHSAAIVKVKPSLKRRVYGILTIMVLEQVNFTKL